MNITEPVKKYTTTEVLVHSCQYHVLWTTKYRRKVLTTVIQARLKELILEKCKEMECTVVEVQIMEDRVHLVLDVNPQTGIYRIVNQIKGYTSRVLRKEFLILKSRIPTLWTRSKFISSVGSVSLEDVNKYVEDQKSR